jgi:hypothetical protein
MSVAAIEWSQGIQDSWSKVAAFVPKLIGFLIVLFIGTIVAKTIRKVAERVLAAAKVDKIVDRSGLGKSLRQSGIVSTSALVVKVLYFGLMLLVLQLAIGALGPSPIADALNSMLAYVPKIIVAIIIVMLTGVVADKVGEIVGSVTAKQSSGRLMKQIAVGTIWVIGGFAALDQIQVARSVVDTLFRTLATSLGAILVIKFGVGGVWAARDRFWPRVYDAVGATAPATPATEK